MSVATLAVGLTFGLAGSANANVLLSGDGLGNESYVIGPNGAGGGYGAGATGSTVVLSNLSGGLPGAWFDNVNGTAADWVSFDAGTGNRTVTPSDVIDVGGGMTAAGGTMATRVVDFVGNTSNYTAVFTEDIVIGQGQTGSLSAQVWADDTAAVYLLAPDGITRTPLFAPNQAQNDPCSGSAIGCDPGHDGMVMAALTQQGTYQFEVYAFQTNSHGFGIRYDGEVTISQVPIPGAVWLFGSAMLGLFGVGHRRKAAA